MLNPLGLSAAESDAALVKNMLGDINMLAGPVKVLDQLIEKACQMNNTAFKACLVVANIIQTAIQVIPETWRVAANAQLLEIRESFADHYFTCYGISKEETRYSFDSFGSLISPPVGAGMGAIARKSISLPSTLRQLTVKVKLLQEVHSKKPFLAETLKTINQIFIHDVSGGKFQYGYMLRSDGALRVYVDLLEAKHPWKSQGLAIKALKEIKQLGEELNATKLQLQFCPANPELLALVKRRFHSLGNQTVFPPHNHIGGVKLPVFLLSEGRIVAKKVSSIPLKVGAAAGISISALQGFKVQPPLLTQPGVMLPKPTLGTVATQTNRPVQPTPASIRERSLLQSSSQVPSSTSVVPVAAPALEWIDMEMAAQKIVDFAADLTGITPAVSRAKELKGLFFNILSQPENAPKLLVNQFLNEPEKIFQKIIAAPKEFIANSDLFLRDPNLAAALGIVSTAFTVVSLTNDIFPVLTKVSREALKNPLKAPIVITKELLKLTTSKIIGVFNLAQGLITNPFKTGEQVIKGLLKTPKQLCRNIKNLFGGGKRKAKRKAKKRARLIAAANEKIRADNEQQRKAVELQKQAVIAAFPPCYKAAQHQWMIEETRNPIDYFSGLLADWKGAIKAKKFSDQFAPFIQRIERGLSRGQFGEVVLLSPLAHTSSPTPPPLVCYAIAHLAQATLVLACEIKGLERKMEANNQAAHTLVNGINSYGAVNSQLLAVTAGKSKERLAEELSHALTDKAKLEACRALLFPMAKR